jgi:hypothetical protein
VLLQYHLLRAEQTNLKKKTFPANLSGQNRCVFFARQQKVMAIVVMLAISEPKRDPNLGQIAWGNLDLGLKQNKQQMR